MKFTPNTYLTTLLSWLRLLGPYAAIELLVPGGSLFAILLWLYRHRPVDAHPHIAEPHV